MVGCAIVLARRRDIELVLGLLVAEGEGVATLAVDAEREDDHVD
jgi:hypothetical protein